MDSANDAPQSREGKWPRLLTRLAHLRHSHKVLLERAGADINVQRDLMRRADAHTTMQVYGEGEFDRMREANGKAVALAFEIESIQ